LKTYVPSRDLLAAISQLLAPRTRPVPRGRTTLRNTTAAETPLQQAARRLQTGRNYLALTIYLNSGHRTYRVASSGPEFACQSMALGEALVGKAAQSGVPTVVPDVSHDSAYRMVHPETRSELVMPIKIAGRVLGVLDVESERLDRFGYAERVLLKKAAGLLALFLTGKGKYLLTRLREAVSAAPAVREVPMKQPRAEAVPPLRAAAGEKRS
jgi:putative methionine-R-sulfoxide reductase with GAF domain